MLRREKLSVTLSVAILLFSSYFSVITAFSASRDAIESEKFSELLHMASSNLSRANSEYHQQYLEYELQLNADAVALIGEEQKFGIYNIPNRCIKIADLDLAVRVLENFSNVIKKLYIAERFTRDILSTFMNPFENVEDLRVDMQKMAKYILSFNELFPKLQRLSLKLQSYVDYSFINCGIQKLEHLSIQISSEAWKRREQIEGLIRKNAQIKSLELNGFPSDYIKIVKEWLPNIEKLTIHGLIQLDTIIRFDHVKNLALYGKIMSLHSSLLTFIQKN